MIEDKNKGITTEYNLLNLPTKVSWTGSTNKIEWAYSATGAKLSKVVYTNGSFAKRIDYAGGFVYERNTANSSPILDYFSFSEGRILNSDGSFKYEYHLTDHWGNVRAAFTNVGSPLTQVQSNFYYPFGMRLARLEGSEANKYLYNGKELEDDNGLYWNDYGARRYLPWLGRWGSMDPADEFHSPYVYVGNNPINLVDPDGTQAYTTQKGYDYVLHWAIEAYKKTAYNVGFDDYWNRYLDSKDFVPSDNRYTSDLNIPLDYSKVSTTFNKSLNNMTLGEDNLIIFSGEGPIHSGNLKIIDGATITKLTPYVSGKMYEKASLITVEIWSKIEGQQNDISIGSMTIEKEFFEKNFNGPQNSSNPDFRRGRNDAYNNMIEELK